MPKPGRIALLVLLVAGPFVASAPAQLPTQHKNLQVLPKETSPRELLDTMKTFVRALDVRCSHCHVYTGSNPDDLSAFDFTSDEKGPKRTARLMMRMVAAINDEHLPKTGKPPAQLLRVGCITCHQGKVRPETLEDALAAALADGGIEAATRRYRELRERYYGRSAYDFGPESLVWMARRLGGEGRLDDAIALLGLALEHHPDSIPTLLTRGELQARKGDAAAARQTLERVIVLEPGNGFAKKLLEGLATPPKQ